MTALPIYRYQDPAIVVEQDEARTCKGCNEVIDLDRIIPALPFVPVRGETALSPGDGILTKVKKVTQILGTNRFVVAGLVLRRAIPLAGGKGQQTGNDTAWMFRLVENGQ